MEWQTSFHLLFRIDLVSQHLACSHQVVTSDNNKEPDPSSHPWPDPLHLGRAPNSKCHQVPSALALGDKYICSSSTCVQSFPSLLVDASTCANSQAGSVNPHSPYPSSTHIPSPLPRPASALLSTLSNLPTLQPLPKDCETVCQVI